MPLTVKEVQNAKTGRHADGQGLYLLVKPSGSKSWVLRVQHRGRRHDFGLGSVSSDKILDDALVPLSKRRSLTLSEAREKARIGRELAKSGVNPSVEWRVDELVVPTFENAAREYHQAVAKAWRNGKHGAQWMTTLETYVFPELGQKLVSDIDAAQIQSVLLPIWLSKPETARRVRQRVAVVLDYAHGKGWRELEAPMRAVNKLLAGIKQPAKGNFGALPWSDVPSFMATLRDGGNTIGRIALQFLILTAARSGEVRGMTWSEVNLESSEWTVPATRMKAGKVHVVPLTEPAVALLASAKLLRMQAGKSVNADDIVFPGLKGQALSDATLAKVVRVHGGGKVTVHGFRSSFRDWAAETGLADAWAEAALAHTVAGTEGKTVAAYKRTTFFQQRRDKLMPAWAAFALNDSSNVVSLAERQA